MENANAECVGPGSELAGKASSCEGCPNQGQCASKEVVVDPAAEQIRERMALIKNKILVLSGKGGVGKSTVSSQLAFSLSERGLQVGLLDIDICGPSVPRMLGLSGHEVHHSASGWQPVYVSDGLGVMSIGFMLPKQDEAVVWRGPRKNGLIKQFLSDVDWGNLDYLIIDTPPGTSDEHIAIVQNLLGASPAGVGAVVVTTPQEVAMADVRKELNFCTKTKIPVYGVIENMSEMSVAISQPTIPIKFVDLNSGNDQTQLVSEKLKELFPELNLAIQFPLFSPNLSSQDTNENKSETLSGPARMAEKYGTSYLGFVPMDPSLLSCGDQGKSLVDTFPNSPASKYLNGIVDKIISKCLK